VVKTFLRNRENFLADKRPTTNIRVFDETVEQLRDEQTRIRKETRIEPSYAELIERAWLTYQARDLAARGARHTEENLSTYSSVHEKFHRQLDEILASHVKDINEAIRLNLSSFKLLANLVKNLVSSGGLPTENELVILRRTLDIIRSQGEMELRQKLLMDLIQQTSSSSTPRSESAEVHSPPEQTTPPAARKKRSKR
jgi:hypothetical protein